MHDISNTSKPTMQGLKSRFILIFAKLIYTLYRWAYRRRSKHLKSMLAKRTDQNAMQVGKQYVH